MVSSHSRRAVGPAQGRRPWDARSNAPQRPCRGGVKCSSPAVTPVIQATQVPGSRMTTPCDSPYSTPEAAADYSGPRAPSAAIRRCRLLHQDELCRLAPTRVGDDRLLHR